MHKTYHKNKKVTFAFSIHLLNNVKLIIIA
jgi:hypothetical protein